MNLGTTPINTGTCPKCGMTIRNVKMEEINVLVGLTPTWHGVSYLCPTCKTVLGVSIDPIALKADIIAGLLEKLHAPEEHRAEHEFMRTA